MKSGLPCLCSRRSRAAHVPLHSWLPIIPGERRVISRITKQYTTIIITILTRQIIYVIIETGWNICSIEIYKSKSLLLLYHLPYLCRHYSWKRHVFSTFHFVNRICYFEVCQQCFVLCILGTSFPNYVIYINSILLNDWLNILNDWIEFYAVSAKFQSWNGGEIHYSKINGRGGGTLGMRGCLACGRLDFRIPY